MRSDAIPGIIVKPTAIYVVTSQPQTFIQKVTLYNLNSYTISYKVRVSAPKRYAFNRIRGLLDGLCCVEIKLRYVPLGRRSDIGITDMISFVIGKYDVITESCQLSGYKSALVHVVRSISDLPDKLRALSFKRSNAQLSSSAIIAAQSLNLDGVVSPSLEGIRYVAIAVAVVCVIMLMLPTKFCGSEEFYGDRPASHGSNNSNAKVVLASFVWSPVSYSYQLTAAYFFGLTTALILISFRLI